MYRGVREDIHIPNIQFKHFIAYSYSLVGVFWFLCCFVFERENA